MSHQQERLNETTHIIAFLTIAVVVAAILYSKIKKSKKNANLVMSWLYKLQFFLPFFILYRHRPYLNSFAWGWGIGGICCLITHWFHNHSKRDYRIINGLEGLFLFIQMSGLILLAGSWYYLFLFYYLEVCNWFEKYVLGR